jgi:hypothetical protein
LARLSIPRETALLADQIGWARIAARFIPTHQRIVRIRGRLDATAGKRRKKRENPRIGKEMTRNNATVRGSAVTVRGSAVTVRGSAVTVRGSAMTVHGRNVTVQGSAVTARARNTTARA